MIFSLIPIMILGCKGDDGADGKVFFTLLVTSDITSLDFSEVAAQTYASVTADGVTKYELTPGSSGDIWWLSGSQLWTTFVEIDPAQAGGEGETSYLPVVMDAKDGAKGKDRIYDLYITGGTLYILDDRLENRVGGDINEGGVIENSTGGHPDAIPAEPSVLRLK